MQTPPPFHGYEGQPAPQKRKTSAVVIIFAVLGVLLVCCGLPVGFLGYFGMKGFKGGMAMVGCMANVNAMKDALHKYQQAHDGKLPSAKTWQTELSTYMVMEKHGEGNPFPMWTPKGEWSCEEGGAKTGFMFNESLSERKVADVLKADPEAIAIFETNTVAYNQSGPMGKLPFSESPKVMGGLIDERRGWFLVNAEGSNVFTRDKNGRMSEFNMNNYNSKSKKNGLNINIDTGNGEGKEKDSEDTKPSKEDNSN